MRARRGRGDEEDDDEMRGTSNNFNLKCTTAACQFPRFYNNQIYVRYGVHFSTMDVNLTDSAESDQILYFIKREWDA